MREFARIGWHMDGMSYDRYMSLTMHESLELHFAVNELISQTDQGLPKRPKEWR